MSRRTFSDAVRWNAIGSVARVATTLVCQLVLLRLLGPLPAGHFAVFLVLVGMGTIFSDGGMMAALTRAPELDDNTVRNALFLVSCYTGVVAVVLLAATGSFMQVFHLERSELYIPLLAVLNVLALGFSSVPLSMLRRQYRSRDVQMIQLGGYVLGFAIVALPLAYFVRSALVMVVAFTVQSFVVLIAALRVSRCPILPRMRGARAIQTTSNSAMLSNVAFYLSESAAGILTAHMVGTRAVGLYGTALNLLRMPTDTIVTTLHAPLLISAAEDKCGPLTRDRFLSTLNVLATTMFACLFAIAYCGDQLVVPLLGNKWADAGPVLSVVALVMMVRLFSMLSGAVIWGQGRLLGDLAAQGAALLVIVLGFVLLRPQDATAVTWIVFASISARMVIQFGVAVHACSISLDMILRSVVAPVILSAVIMLPIHWLAPSVLPRFEFFGLIMLGAAGAILLLIRVGLGMWLAPHAWTHSILSRLPKLGRRADVLAASREPAPSDRTMMSTTEIP